jgi:flagellar basal body-associated protein FliL
MKSCLGLLIVLFVFTIVVGGGALVWYLSDTAEFARNDAAPAPKAVHPAQRR